MLQRVQYHFAAGSDMLCEPFNPLHVVWCAQLLLFPSFVILLQASKPTAQSATTQTSGKAIVFTESDAAKTFDVKTGDELRGETCYLADLCFAVTTSSFRSWSF